MGLGIVCGTWKWRPRTLTKTSRYVWTKRCMRRADAEGGLEGFFPNTWVAPHRICPRGLIVPHDWRLCSLFIVYDKDFVKNAYWKTT